MYDGWHACPGGCGKQVPPHLLSCPKDWYRLPEPIRVRVSLTYRRMNANPDRHIRAVRAALSWYVDNPRGVKHAGQR